LGFIDKEMWPVNSPEMEPPDYYVWENVRGLSQVPSETENIAILKKILQMTVKLVVR